MCDRTRHLIPTVGQWVRTEERAIAEWRARYLLWIFEPLEVPGSPANCQLTIGGQPAIVLYCGAAPGAIIDQLNFVYPSGVVSKVAYVDATLTISGVTGRFRIPAPATSREP